MKLKKENILECRVSRRRFIAKGLFFVAALLPQIYLKGNLEKGNIKPTEARYYKKLAG